MILKSINPYTNKTIGEFEEYSDEKVNEILLHSAEAFDNWRMTDFVTPEFSHEECRRLAQDKYQ